MKELLTKFFSLFSEGIEKLEANNQDEALVKFKEASNLTEEVTKTSENMIEKTELETEVKKYVDMYISADNVTDLKDQLKALTEAVETIQKDKETDDEAITKAVNDLVDRLEKVEKFAISKIK